MEENFLKVLLQTYIAMFNLGVRERHLPREFLWIDDIHILHMRELKIVKKIGSLVPQITVVSFSFEDICCKTDKQNWLMLFCGLTNLMISILYFYKR